MRMSCAASSRDRRVRRYSALVPNEAGYERLRSAALPVAAIFVSASETPQPQERELQHRGAARALRARGGARAGGRRVAARVRLDRVRLPVRRRRRGRRRRRRRAAARRARRRRDLARRHDRRRPSAAGARAGARPWRARSPLERIALHLHDTCGRALANVQAGYEAGVRTFDASLGGLGGCPYAPGASGNVATEDVVDLFERAGVATGVDLDALVDTTRLARARRARGARCRAASTGPGWGSASGNANQAEGGRVKTATTSVRNWRASGRAAGPGTTRRRARRASSSAASASRCCSTPDSFVEDAALANSLAGDLPADGVVTGIGRVDGRPVCVMANDSTVKAGSWGARTVEKILRIQETRRAPARADGLPRRLGRRAHHRPGPDVPGPPRRRAHLPQPGAGSRAGPAGLPALRAVGRRRRLHPGLLRRRVHGRGQRLHVPRLAAHGRDGDRREATLEEMGGARMHCSVSGCGDFLAKTDEEAIAARARYLSYLPAALRRGAAARGGARRPRRPAPISRPRSRATRTSPSTCAR